MHYIRLAFWALVVLWKFRTIHPVSRLHLWRKTMNLFVCFLAFTDGTRPYQQLRGAMLSAILSALYDHDTDWVLTKRHDDPHFLSLLEKEVEVESTRVLARELFNSDKEDRLSVDGLERGSIALLFYHSLIQSEWMRRYSDEEITLFGRRLQIIDDVLDREEDARVGDKNCLVHGAAETYLRELRKFLESAFFLELANRSRMYRKFDRAFRREIGEKIPLNASELIETTRPLTVVFAFVLTCLGFKFVLRESPAASWSLTTYAIRSAMP